MKKSRSLLRKLAAYFYAALWENRCRVCGDPCPPGDAITLCPKCAEELRPIREGFCPCCGQILKKTDKRRFFCPDCLFDPPPWQEIHLFGAYKNLLRDLLIDFKFRGNLASGHLVGALLARSMPDSFRNAPHILVPMPLSRERLQERGFNQVLELARPVIRRFSFPLATDILTRVKNTAPQSSLKGGERRANITGAFSVAPDKVAGKHIILMDDVMTTGCTLREAAKVLLAAGAASICVLIAARTPQPESGLQNSRSDSTSENPLPVTDKIEPK